MRLPLIILIALSMSPFATSAETESQTADQFLRAAMAADLGRNEFAERVMLVNDAAQYCCKTCTSGKACGNTCISRDKTCRVGPGCACDG
jgi:hypothetical protein